MIAVIVAFAAVIVAFVAFTGIMRAFFNFLYGTEGLGQPRESSDSSSSERQIEDTPDCQGETAQVNEITEKETSLECNKTELSKFQEQQHSLSVELEKQTQICITKNANVKQLQQKMNSVQEKLAQFKQDENKTKNNIEQVNNKLTHINTESNHIKELLQHVTTDSPEMREMLDSILSGEKERFDYMSRKQRLQEKKLSLEKEKTAVEKEIFLLRARLGKIQKKRLHYEQERDQVSTCLDEAKKQLNECLGKKRKLEKQITTCARQVSNQERVIKDQTNDLLQTYRNERKRLDSQIAEFPEWHLNKFGFSLEECIERLGPDSCSGRLNDLKEDKRSCEKRIAELKMEMRQLAS